MSLYHLDNIVMVKPTAARLYEELFFMTVQVGDRIEGVNNQYGQDFSFISGVVTKVFESGDIDVLPDSYENPYSWPEEGSWILMS